MVLAAREAHYGAYMANQKDWPLVQDIGKKTIDLWFSRLFTSRSPQSVSGMSHSFIVPTSVKIRLAQPAEKTVNFAQRLEACGAAWVTLHPRTVSARRRRQGAADLDQVKKLKKSLRVPVISNGNVREWSNIPENLEYTGADGVMVGETLLGNPWSVHDHLPSRFIPNLILAPFPPFDSLFANEIPDPVDIALEYLNICRQFPGTASVSTMQTHIRHFVDYQCGRCSWFQKFRAALGATQSLEEMDALVRVKVQRWRGKPPRGQDFDIHDDDNGANFLTITNEEELHESIDLGLIEPTILHNVDFES
ncbi:hypothetical protein C0992_007962 [Termitomyces sp. T32_za158]|nr:hypothetical protein C0992_007962 [Termitomyces sp. T32_za158]